MNSSFTKIFEAEKFGKNKSLGKKIYARRVIMQSLKSIRPAEVDNFFKQSFEQKKKLIPLYMYAGMRVAVLAAGVKMRVVNDAGPCFACSDADQDEVKATLPTPVVMTMQIDS